MSCSVSLTERMRIGILDHSRKPLRTSIPSLSGRPRSSTIISGRAVRAWRNPSSPDSASSTWNPPASRVRRSSLRICTSSSMTRIRTGLLMVLQDVLRADLELRGEPYDKLRAPLRFVSRPDRAAMHLDESLHNRQAQPGPPGLGSGAPVELAEDVGDRSPRKPRAVVRDDDHQILALDVRAQFDFRASRRIEGCVVQKICDRLLDEAEIQFYKWHLGRDFDDNSMMRQFPLELSHGAVEEVAYVAPVPAGRDPPGLQAGHGEEVFHQPVQPFRRGVDFGRQVPPDLIAVSRGRSRTPASPFGEQTLGGGEDCRDGCPQFVRYRIEERLVQQIGRAHV